MQFETKSRNLKNVSGLLTRAMVLPQIGFTFQEWQKAPRFILNMIKSNGWVTIPLIVRSSALDEDGIGSSGAGKYLSVSNLIGTKAVRKAVNEVLASYSNQDKRNEVFIQPMLQNVVISGVAFSKDPNTKGNYIVINYDSKSGDTTTVTSGITNELNTYYYFKGGTTEPDGFLKNVIDLVGELEAIFENDCLDLEFAVIEGGELILLQVRELNLHQKKKVELKTTKAALNCISGKLAQLNQRLPYLFGSRTVFGIMPDWNPAEIIGVRPRPLALSLYKEIITDAIWAYQRDNYGYRNLRSFPLMIDFCGLPYIDTRVSFNSFIPKGLDDSICEKMVNYYTHRLIENPSYHDKVEFEIVFTCYTPDILERIQNLKEHDFSDRECQQIVVRLRDLTNKIINPDTGLWLKDLEKIQDLDSRRRTVLQSSLDTISKVYWLLEDCKRYGTLPFAGLARVGFIAAQLLDSLVNIGVLSEEDKYRFMKSVNTISSQMASDFKILSKAAFLDKYGHLRPGTYDILSPRYDESPDQYFNWESLEELLGQEPEGKEPFLLSLEQLGKLKTLLDEHGMDHDVLNFFDFIRRAIEAREYAKFVFTKSLSDALSLIKKIAVEHGFNHEDSSYINIQDLIRLYSSSEDVYETLSRSIKTGKKKYRVAQSITLPFMIVDQRDVWAFHTYKTQPNYITQKRVIGEVCSVNDDPNNKILLIDSADPGYDWIFSRNIKGFITKYGGVNSHMAIRSGELGIPAIIGIGDEVYNRLNQAELVEIDCAKRQYWKLR